LHKNAKDRHMLLQLEEHMIKLVKDPERNSQKFPAMSSYNRMLVHRVAAFFGLDHNVDQNGTAVVVNKTSHTRLFWTCL
uniref:R3H domain-containing protein n=1 Tax=Gongylonema pulchrum TaxID=637853 RepID=A0A183ETF4_9BILA